MAGKPFFDVISEGLISSASSDYEVEDILGSGSFGVVTQCSKRSTNETVALKIIQNRISIDAAMEEEATLKKMKELDSDMFNIIRWNDSFTYEGFYCLEFEKLDMSLHEFLQRSQDRSLELKEIRPIVQQLATALEFLKTVRIIHADLKPENIMMVDHIGQPLRVKVIDFGLACEDPEVLRGVTLQTLWYRSPEILIGAPFSEAIDVWSLGCIAAEIFIGIPLFPSNDEYDMVRHIEHTIGNPPDYLLDAGMYTGLYYHESRSVLEAHPWRLMSSLQGNFSSAPCTITSLDDLMMVSDNISGGEAEAFDYDLVSFVDLLKQMLMVDSGERITPSHVLQHPFITMKHLTCAINDSPYVKSCEELMSACEELSSDSMDVAQMTLNASLTEESAHSPASPSNHTVPNEDNPAGSSDKPYCFLQRTIITWENSPYKRKRDDDDDDADAPAEDENRNSPDISPAKRGRSQWLALSLTEASGEMSPAESPQHKRKRDDDDDLRITSPAKRWRGINLNKELTDSVKKLLNNSAGAQSSSTEVNYPRKRKRDDEEASGLIEEDHLKKRKRDDEEASGSDQSSTEKRRRESLHKNDEIKHFF